MVQNVMSADQDFLIGYYSIGTSKQMEDSMYFESVEIRTEMKLSLLLRIKRRDRRPNQEPPFSKVVFTATDEEISRKNRESSSAKNIAFSKNIKQSISHVLWYLCISTLAEKR